MLRKIDDIGMKRQGEKHREEDIGSENSNDCTKLQINLGELSIIEFQEPLRKKKSALKNPEETEERRRRKAMCGASSSIKRKVSNRCQIIREAVRELGGECSFGELVQYIRASYSCANNSTCLILHALKLALQKQRVYMFQSSIVTKEVLKKLRAQRELLEENENSSDDDVRKHHRFSYRILKNQLLKSFD